MSVDGRHRTRTHQWRGVIEEYRDWLPLPEGTPTFTLREGGTPLIDSPWLSERPARRCGSRSRATTRRVPSRTAA